MNLVLILITMTALSLCMSVFAAKLHSDAGESIASSGVWFAVMLCIVMAIKAFK